MVITHDRAFLDDTVTRIIELDRGVLRSYPGNFAAYEARKEEELAAEALERARFDKFHAQEEVWIRKGIEARRTRNEGRVSASKNCGASVPHAVNGSGASTSRLTPVKKAAKSLRKSQTSRKRSVTAPL